MVSDPISNHISPQMDILNMVIPILMHLGLSFLPLKSLFCLKMEHCKPHTATCHPRKGDIIHDAKLFLALHSGYTVTNFQTSCYKIRCITYLTHFSIFLVLYVL